METLENRIEVLERRLRRAEGRLRATWACAFAGALGALALGGNPQARAQFGITLASLNTRLIAVETKTQDITRLTDPNTGQPTVRLSGVNLQVVDGSGSTGGVVNGLGNLIVGYNELRNNPGSPDNRTGSHNLIVGNQNSYQSFGGLVAGSFNTVSGVFASVSGGAFNIASGDAASVSGGDSSEASGLFASVSGGFANLASGEDASVSGGDTNEASGFASSVSGGFFNLADGDSASVLGGTTNEASGLFASVSGGSLNTAGGSYSSVSGGGNRTIGSTAAEDNDWRAGTLFQDF